MFRRLSRDAFRLVMLEGLALIVALVLTGVNEPRVLAQDAVVDDYRAAMASGFALKEAGKIDQSCQLYEKAIELAKTNRDRCEAHAALIRIYPELEQSEKMFESLEFVLRKAPYPAMASLTLSSAVAVCQRKGLINQMQERYSNQLKQSPKDRVALTVMCELAGNTGRSYATRADYLQRLIDLDKEEGFAPDPSLHSQLAFMWMLDDQSQKAAEMYEYAATLNKERAGVCWKDAAICWKKAANKERALAAALKAHEIGDDPASKHRQYEWDHDLGKLFVLLGQKELALKYTAAALEGLKSEFHREECEILVLAAKGLPDSP